MIRNQPRPIGSMPFLHVAETSVIGVARVIGWLARLRYHPMGVLALTGFVIEALLGLRLWVQLSNSPISGTTVLLMDVTNKLVSPFRSLDGVVPIKQTGILEFATLAAIEAYLVLALALVLLFFAGGEIFRDISRMVSAKHHSSVRRTEARNSRHP